MTRGLGAWRAPRGAVVLASCMVSIAVIVAGCGGQSGPASTSAPGAGQSTLTSPSPSTSATNAAPVAVSDGTGARFDVQATPLILPPYATVDAFMWSAAPGQDFLVDTLTVTNPPGDTTESLTDFDDLESGLADDLQFVMSATNAAKLGYSTDCAVDPTFPPSLCPISLGQGLTVDTDSANHDDRSVVLLAPGASTQITLSYGPVLDDVTPDLVSVYFDDGQAPPVDLSP